MMQKSKMTKIPVFELFHGGEHSLAEGHRKKSKFGKKMMGSGFGYVKVEVLIGYAGIIIRNALRNLVLGL